MPPYIKRIPRILAPTQCAALIAQLDKEEDLEEIHGYAEQHRGIHRDPELASQLKHSLFPQLGDCGVDLSACIVNDHFRFSRQGAGGQFGLHTDGANGRWDGADNCRSVFTVNINLNTDFSGGRTQFQERKADQGENRVAHQWEPETGCGVVFDTEWPHCGEFVAAGTKQLLRTDIQLVKQRK